MINSGCRKIKASSNKQEIAVIDTAIGRVALTFDADVLVTVDLFADKKLSAPQSLAAKEACRQIQNYFASKLPNMRFDIVLDARGTEFQRKVWQALQQIPAGSVLSYGKLAKQLKTSARAVGNACRANPIPLIIPCHRVVAQSGIGGFAGARSGAPLRIKMQLLEHERAGHG